jgi:hypothetical protein
MRRFTFVLVAVATMASLVTLIAPAPGHADGQPAPPFVTEIPHGYRDWRWISSAHEAGNLNSLGAVLGNDVAIKAYREGKLPLPGRINHCRFALPSRLVGRKQQSLWPSPIFRSRRPYERSIYGQGLNQVRRNRRLGVRSFCRRQTRRCGVHENLLPLPREDQSDRSCLYSLCTLMLRTRAERNETTARSSIPACALNGLAVAREHLGSLGKVTQVVRLGRR